MYAPLSTITLYQCMYVCMHTDMTYTAMWYKYHIAHKYHIAVYVISVCTHYISLHYIMITLSGSCNLLVANDSLVEVNVIVGCSTCFSHGAAMDSLSLTTTATSGHVDTGSKSLHVCVPVYTG